MSSDNRWTDDNILLAKKTRYTKLIIHVGLMNIENGRL